MLNLIPPLFSKYWKPIGLVLILSLSHGYAFYKGYSYANELSARKQAKNLEKRIDKYIEVRDTNDEKVDRIKTHRRDHKDDERDSCILSDNPLNSSCI